MGDYALFQDLVIYVVAYKDVEASQTSALVTKLQENGAAVSKRFSDKVTHVVVQRTHAPADEAEGDSRLRDIFQRIDKVRLACPWHPLRAAVSSSLLLQLSQQQGGWL